MIKDLIKFANKVYPLQALIRYNHVQKVNNESVIEHTGFVAMLTLELGNYYNFNMLKALKMAINHDKPEIYITDVPHSVKEMFPKLKEMIKICEYDALYKFDKETRDTVMEFDGCLTPESKIVNLADVISCIQYSLNEMKFGHVDYMNKVYIGSNERAIKLIKELDIHLK